MLVVSTYGFNTPGSRRIGRASAGRRQAAWRRRRVANRGHRRCAPRSTPTGRRHEARLPFVLGAFVLFTLLALIVILRAPLLALLAVCLNLASVAAAIGVLTLICQIPAGYPLGGHPYIDTVGAGAIFGVTFGLSIDYAVFLIARMRERYLSRRRQPSGDRIRPGEDRRSDYRRCRDHGGGLHLVRDRADRDREPDGCRARQWRSCSTRLWCGSCCCPRSCFCWVIAFGTFRGRSIAFFRVEAFSTGGMCTRGLVNREWGDHGWRRHRARGAGAGWTSGCWSRPGRCHGERPSGRRADSRRICESAGARLQARCGTHAASNEGSAFRCQGGTPEGSGRKVREGHADLRVDRQRDHAGAAPARRTRRGWESGSRTSGGRRHTLGRSQPSSGQVTPSRRSG